jgi:endogenous inhibitor of DNA gyrase (YacG/DUF329 family)
MKRDTYIPVTEIPVLIPCVQKEQDGVANFYGGEIVRERGELVALYQPVRALRDDELTRKSEAGKKLWKGLEPAEQERLMGLIALRKALESRDALAMEKLEHMYRKLVPDIRHCSWPPPSLDEPETMTEVIKVATARTMAQSGTPKPPGYLPLLLTRALRRARLVLWWHDKERRFLPAIYCPDVATALYVRALVGIVGGRALLVCPRCGKPFVQERSDQDYCSIRCREAHRVARWRAASGKRHKVRRSDSEAR